MKTTVELPDRLLRRAKAFAALRGISLRALLTDSVERRLRAEEGRSGPAWRELHGDLASLRRETRRINELVHSEFEQLDAEDAD